MHRSFAFFLILSLILVGCTIDQPTPRVETSPAIALTLTPDPNVVLAGFCSKENVVQSVDFNGEPTSVNYEQLIRLSSSSSSVTFYSDASCTSRINVLKFTPGQDSAVFYFRPNKSEYITITSSASNLKADTQSKTVVSPFASQLRVLGKDSLLAGKCSDEILITALNYKGEESQVKEPVVVNLSGNGVGKFYLNSDCSGPPINSTTIITGQSSKPVYYKTNKVGVYNFNVEAPGPITSKLSVSVHPNTPYRAIFVTPPQYIEAGVCSAQYVVQIQDAFGNASKVASDEFFNLTGNAMTFYKDKNCLSILPTYTVPAGQDSFSFYVNGMSVGETDVRVSGFTVQSQTLNISSSKPVSLKLSEIPDEITAGAVLGKIGVTVQDRFNNKVPDANKTVVLAAYSDSGCNTLANKTLDGFSQVTAIDGVANFVSISYSKAETIYLGARSGSLTPACSGKVLVKPDFPSKLKIDGPDKPVAGVCQPYSLVATDKFGNESNVELNTTISFSGLGFGTFHSLPTCSDEPILATTIMSGLSNKVIYYKNRKTEDLSLTFTGLGPTSSKKKITIVPGSPFKLAVTGPQTVIAGQCTPGYAVTIQDTFGNASPVPDDLDVSFSSNNAKGEFFYDQLCATKALPVTISKGTASKNLYYRNRVAETSINTFMGPPGSNVVLVLNSTPAAASKLSIVSPSQIKAGTKLSNLVVHALDENDNIATSYNKNITVFPYVDSECSVSSATSFEGIITKPPVAGIASYDDAKYTRSEVIYVGAKGEGVKETCSHAISIFSTDATRLKLTGTDSQPAGHCNILNLASTDDFNNLIPVHEDTSVLLSGSGSGKFFNTSDCSGFGSNVVIIRKNTSSSKLYFKGTKTENLTLNASTAGLAPAEFRTVVTPLSPKKVSISGVDNIKVDECSSELTVTSEDIYSNPSPVSFETRIVLAQSGSGSFYSDPACTSTISTAKILVNTSKSQVYFKDKRAELVKMEVVGPELSSGKKDLVVGALFPTKVSAVGPSIVYAGICSQAFIFQSRDNFDNISPVTEPVAASLSDYENGEFFNEPDCSGAAVNSAVVSAGQDHSKLYFKTRSANDVTLKINAFNFESSYKFKVNPAPPSKVTFLTEPKSIIAGTCSGTTIVQAKDENDNATTATSDIEVNISGNFLSFYKDSNCTGTQISSVVISKDSETATFFVSGSSSMASELKIESMGSVEIQPFSVIPFTPARVGILEAPSSGVPSLTKVFSFPIKTSIQDQYGNNTTNSSNKIFVAPYLDSSCKVLASKLFSGETFKDAVAGIAEFPDLGYTTSGKYYIGASSDSLLTGCSSVVDIEPENPYLIKLSGSNTAKAGLCNGPFKIEAQDVFGNLAKTDAAVLVTFSGLGTSGAVHTTSACTDSSSNKNITIPANESSVSFYYKTTAVALNTLSATSSLGPATFPVDVVSNSATKIAVSGPSQIYAGKCSSAFTLKIQDSWNNAATFPESTDYVLNGKKSGAFFSDASCQNQTDTVTLLSGKSENQFYYLNPTLGETTVLNSIKSGFSAIGASVSVRTPPPVKILLAGETLISAGWCIPYTATLLDESGVPAEAVFTTSLALSGQGGGVYYSDENCSNPVNSVSVSTLTSSKIFWYKSSSTEAVRLEASGSGLTTGYLPITVKAGIPTGITFKTQPPLIVKAGDVISEIKVFFSDRYNNPAFVDDGSQIIVELINSNGTSTSIELKGKKSDTPSDVDALVTYSDLKIEKVGQFKLKISGKEFTAESNSFTVIPGVVSKLIKISGDGQGVLINTDLLNPLIVKATDLYDNITDGIGVSWTANGFGTMTPSTGVTNSSGLTESRFKANTAGVGLSPIRSSISSNPLIYADFSVVIVAISKFAVSGPNDVTNNKCGGPFLVETLNAAGTNITTEIPLTSNLSSSISGVYFYSDASCLTPISSVTVNSGSKNAPFYVKTTVTSTFTITASSSLVTQGSKVVKTLSYRWSAASLDFGTVNSNRDLSLTFYNDGEALPVNVTISGPNVGNGLVGLVQNNCNNQTILQGGSCSLIVRFNASNCGTNSNHTLGDGISLNNVVAVPIYGRTSYSWVETSNEQDMPKDGQGNGCIGLHDSSLNVIGNTTPISGSCSRRCDVYKYWESKPYKDPTVLSCGSEAWCCYHTRQCL